METVVTCGEDVEFALNAHGTHLLPCLHGVHSCPNILVPMHEEHRTSLQVEVELGSKYGTIVCSARRVMLFQAVCQGVGGIDADAPLHVTRLLVEIIDGKVSYRQKDGSWAPVMVGMDLTDTMKVATGLNSTMIVYGAEKTVVVLPLNTGNVSEVVARCSKAVLRKADGSN